MKKYSILLLLNIAFNLSAADSYTPEALQTAADLVLDRVKTLIDQGKEEFFSADRTITTTLQKNNLHNKYITSLLDLIIFKKLNMNVKFKERTLEKISQSNLTSDVLNNFFELRGLSIIAANLFGAQPEVPFNETIERIKSYKGNPFDDDQYRFITNNWLAVNPEDQNLELLSSYLELD